MAVVYLIRHGQASFGESEYDRLSPLGEEQSSVLGAALAPRIGTLGPVVCGAMERHRATAARALAAMGLPASWQENPAWNEYDHLEILRRFEPRFADAEAMLAEMRSSLGEAGARRAFQATFGRAIARWVGGQFAHEYTESWPAFRSRVIDGFRGLVAALGASRTALVFTSGGPITAICAELLGLPDERSFALNWTLANAGLTKIVCGRGGTWLATLNDHVHFEAERRDLLTYR